MQGKAGYILQPVRTELHKKSEKIEVDEHELKIQGLLENLTTFDYFSPIALKVPTNPDQILAVAYNIVTRGTPTLASPTVEEYYSKEFGLSTKLNSDYLIQYELKEEVKFSDLFAALHPIDSSLLDRAKHLNINASDSDFERNFLTKLIPENSSPLAFIIDQQRERKSLGASRGNHGRVDFSLEIPYFNLEIQRSRFSTEVEVRNRRKYVVEVDGEKYHEQLIDDLKDLEIGQISTKINHIREGHVYSDMSDFMSSIQESEFYSRIQNNFTNCSSQLIQAYNLMLGPIALARLQYVILRYLLSNPSTEKLEIAVVERDIQCGYIGITDLNELLNNLAELSNNSINGYDLNCEIYRDPISDIYLGSKPDYKKIEELNLSEYDLVIDISVLSRSDKIIYPKAVKGKNVIEIRNAHYTKSETVNSLISSESIKYKEVVKPLPNEEYEVILEVEKPLVYFLNLLFRKKRFRVGQLPILNRALQLRSVIGLLPTGGGKSLTYQLASMLQPGITIIVDPIKSLMKDQFDSLKEIGITRTSFLNSELSSGERNYTMKSMTKGCEQFIFISPERYVMDSFREALRNTNENGHFFSYVVIDEVHCVSEWGHNFRTPYLDLGKNAIKYTKTYTGDNIPIFGLTATASFDVLADIERELQIPEDDGHALVRYENTVRDEINYLIVEAPVDFTGLQLNSRIIRNRVGEIKQELLKNWLVNLPQTLLSYNKDSFFESLTEQSYDSFLPATKTDVTLSSYQEYKKHQLKLDEKDLALDEGNYQLASVVFCPHRNGSHGVYQIRSTLKKDIGFDLPVGTFSGGDDKELAKKSFENQDLFKSNEFPVMIATKAFGMGIDKPNVRSTIHINVPESVESFVQEAGRAGRDRKLSLSMILINRDKPEIFKNDDPTSGETVQFWSDKEILDYFHSLSFKGEFKERRTLFELRSKVVFPNIKRIQLLEFRINERLDLNRVKLNLPKRTHSGYIFVNDAITDEGIGRISLQDLSYSFYNYFGKVDKHLVFESLKSLIQNSGHNGVNQIREWLNSYTVQSESTSGIERMLQKMQVGDEELIQIPFRNKYNSSFGENNRFILNQDHLQMILNNKLIQELIRSEKLSENVLRASLSRALSNGGNDIEFLETLSRNNEELKQELNWLTTDETLRSRIGKLRSDFFAPRTEEDTAKGIYRLISIGVIDTYTIDYQNKLYNVRFTKKEHGAYFLGLKQLISRYTSERAADKEIKDLIESSKEDLESGKATEISICLKHLTDFIYNRIAEKRRRAINDMLDLCTRALDESDPIEQNLKVKEYIYFYFNAKYSRFGNEAQIEKVDQEGNTIFEVEPASLLDEFDNDYSYVIRKYIRILHEDRTGAFKDNLKHLRGATLRVLRDRPSPPFLILKGFTLFVLSQTSKNLLDEAYEEIVRGFVKWKQDFSDVNILSQIGFIKKELLRHINDQEIESRIERIAEEFNIRYYSHWLNKFKIDFLNNYTHAE